MSIGSVQSQGQTLPPGTVILTVTQLTVMFRVATTEVSGFWGVSL